MQVDLCEDAVGGVEEEAAGEVWTPQKVPETKTHGRWRPPTVTSEQKKEGWMPGASAKNELTKELVAKVKNKEVSAGSCTDYAWEASARQMGIFVDKRGI